MEYTVQIYRTFVKEVIFETELSEEELDDIVNSLDDLENDDIHILETTDFKDSMDVDILYCLNENNEYIFEQKESDCRHIIKQSSK